MTLPIPRFEFRTFSYQLDQLEDSLLQHIRIGNRQESQSLYILSRNTNRTNARIKDRILEVSELHDIQEGFEQWMPRLHLEFPLSARVIEDEVLPMLGVRHAIRLEDLSLEEFIDKIILSSDHLLKVEVNTRWNMFEVVGAEAELAEILVQGAYIKTLALVSSDPSTLFHAMATLGISGQENINYPTALKRITGMATWPVSPSF